MNDKLLQRIMRLIERTGDRMIVVNPESGKAHAVLPFDDYEKISAGQASLLDLVDGECECEDDDEFPWNLNDDKNDEDKIFDEITAIEEEVAKESEKMPKDPIFVEKKEDEGVDAINKKLAEESQKISANTIPLDALDDEVGDDQYYVEPIE
jgi:hypothetical protein